MRTTLEMAMSVHGLYEACLTALDEERNYDCFVLMLERSKTISEWTAYAPDSTTRELWQSTMVETAHLEGRIRTRLQYYEESMQREFATAEPRRAYMRSMACNR